MACSKTFLSFILLNLFSFFNICLSDGSGSSLDQLLPGLEQSAILMDAQCMQKMIPCQPYLKNPTNIPPTCCNPLNDLVTNSSECLCNILNNPKLIGSIDVTKDEILKLPAACGIHVDASKCNAEATSPSSQVDDETAAEDATSEESTSSTETIKPFGITYFGVPGFVALLTALVFSA